MASRLVVLTLLAALTAARADYEFALDEQSLAPHPDWTGRDKAESYGHSFADGVASFRASGKGRTMVWARHFDPPMDLKGLRYVTLRYRAENLNPELFSYLLFLSNATDGRMRADYLGATAGDLVIDGDWHVFTTELKFRDRLCSVALRFQSLPGTEGRLEVSRLALTADPPRFPIATDLDWRRGVDPAAGQPLAVAEPTTQVPALQTALSYALTPVFDELRKAFGLDVFTIRYEIDRPLEIQASKYLLKHLYVTLFVEVGGPTGTKQTVKVDYELNISSMDVTYDNDTLAGPLRDVGLSNAYRIGTLVNAGYVNWSTRLSPHWSMQTGLRVEQNGMNAKRTDMDIDFSYSYPDGLKDLGRILFPAAYFSRKWDAPEGELQRELQVNISRKVPSLTSR